MAEKIIIKVTNGRRMSLSPPVCNILGIDAGERLEGRFDVSGKQPKLILERQRNKDETEDE